MMLIGKLRFTEKHRAVRARVEAAAKAKAAEAAQHEWRKVSREELQAMCLSGQIAGLDVMEDLNRQEMFVRKARRPDSPHRFPKWWPTDLRNVSPAGLGV